MTAAAPDLDPLASPRTRLICAALVFLSAIVLYISTLAPTVTLVDSGELILAAKTLGVAHPPGFPLYVLLTHFFTWLPLGNVAARVNLASAVFAAFASAILTLAVAEVLLVPKLPPNVSGPVKGRRRARVPASTVVKADDRSSESGGMILAVLPCIAAGLLFACSRTLWAYATITEVYTLNTLLICLIFFLMFRWRRRLLTEHRQGSKKARRGGIASPHDRWLYAAAFVFGLAMGVHHVSVAVTLPGIAVLVLATEGIAFFASKRLLKAAVISLLGLAIYVYLPLAAMRSPAMNWGNPRTLEEIWWHVSGRQYQAFLSTSAEIIARQFKTFLELVGREFNPIWGPVGLLAAIGGLISIFRRDRTMFWFAALVIVADLAYGLNYEIAEDKDAYYLPVFVTLAIAAGCGIAWLGRSLRRTRMTELVATSVSLILAAILPCVALASNLPYNNRHRYFIASDYIKNIESTIEPNGMLLTLDWQVYSPLLYLREIEGLRKDIIAIDVLQLRRSWYYDYLEQAYPALMAANRDKVDAFLEDLHHWEHDPDAYKHDNTLIERINTRFYDMIEALVTGHSRNAPVYITLDVAVNVQGENSELTTWLNKTYGLLPSGLVFQVIGKGEYREPPTPSLETRGLNDGSLRFADDDVVKVKILPVYPAMLSNRGRYLAANGRHEQAISAFKEALAIEPNYRPAEQAMNESLEVLQKAAAAK